MEFFENFMLTFCSNEDIKNHNQFLARHTHTHTFMYIYIYIYIYRQKLIVRVIHFSVFPYLVAANTETLSK